MQLYLLFLPLHLPNFWHLWWVGPEHCSSAIPNPKAKVLNDYDAADKNELSLLADEVSDMALA